MGRSSCTEMLHRRTGARAGIGACRGVPGMAQEYTELASLFLRKGGGVNSRFVAIHQGALL